MRGGRLRGLQVGLSAVAGFVDAIVFLALGGFYVAFMSGNSTMVGMEVGTRNLADAAVTGGVVGCFVLGVATGTLVGQMGIGRVGVQWGPVAVLVLVAGLLATAAGCGRLGLGGMRVVAALLVAAAMGAENTAFDRPGHQGIGLTYMTGTLVRVGRRVSEAVSGGGWAGMVPDALLWLGMVVGAGLGGGGVPGVGPAGALRRGGRGAVACRAGGMDGAGGGGGLNGGQFLAWRGLAMVGRAGGGVGGKARKA